MLVEIALTPGVLDPSIRRSEPDLLAAQIRSLGRVLLRNAHDRDGALCIGNLCEGAWLGKIRELATRCADPKLGPLLRQLCPTIAEHALIRPYAGNSPHTDHEWAEEALACHTQQARFARIATSTQCRPNELGIHAELCDLGGIVADSFSESVKSAAYPFAYIESQVNVLRPLFRRADWLAFVLPDVRVGIDDETPFLLECVQAYQLERKPFGEMSIRVVTRAARNKRPELDADYESISLQQKGEIEKAIDEVLDSDVKWVEVVIDHTVLNRYVVAGTLSGVERKARWAIDLGHPARIDKAEAERRAKREKRPISKENWRLLSAVRVSELFNQYCV